MKRERCYSAHGSGALAVRAGAPAKQSRTTRGKKATLFIELIVLACIFTGGCHRVTQEVCYYKSGRVTAEGNNSYRIRSIHSVEVRGENIHSRLSWVRGEKTAVVSLEIDPEPNRKRKKQRRQNLKVVRVVVPASWKFLTRLEGVRHRFQGDQSIRPFIENWDFADYLHEFNFAEEKSESLAAVEVKTFYPDVRKMAVSAEESLRVIGEALERLTTNTQSQTWAKHLKTPEIWKPENREAEIKGWSDWKFSFVNYVRAVDPKLAELMEWAERQGAEEIRFDDMSAEARAYAPKLFNMVCSYVKLRPLKLIRFTERQNGFKAWKVLVDEMQPATRQRSLALMTQLSRIQFQSDKGVGEQLPLFEALVTEYERVSQNTYSDDAKVAAVLLACPSHLKQHLQLWVSESTTYELLKSKILQLEAMNTRWDSGGSLSMPSRAGNILEDSSSPMDVDYIQQKGGKGKKGFKGKGKDSKGGKSKGKDKGKSNWQSSKGKSSWEKGQGKQKGKSKEKGGKNEKGCFTCGKPGHMAKDCWRRVQQVSEQHSTGPSSSAGVSSTTAPTTVTNQVKMVRLVTPPNAPVTELFDLTEADVEEADEIPITYFRVIRVVDPDEVAAVEEDEKFEDCYEIPMEVPLGTPVVALHLQDEDEEEEGSSEAAEEEKAERHERREIEEMRIQVIELDMEAVTITLDSGADISVLPKRFSNCGRWSPGNAELRMIDAQGREIGHSGVTKVKLKACGEDGKAVEIVEDFVLGDVKHPILCAGRMLRQGWSINNEDGSLFLVHSSGTRLPLAMQRNSLHFDAKIQAIEVKEVVEEVKQKLRRSEADEVQRNENAENAESEESSGPLFVFALRGYLSKYVKVLESTPGWHRLPNGISVYSDPVATTLLDPRQSVEGDFKGRLTLMKEKDGMWSQIENADNYLALGSLAFRKLTLDDEPQRTLTFFSPGRIKDYWEVNSEVPVSPYPEAEELVKAMDWSEDEAEGEEALEERLREGEEQRLRFEERDEAEVELDNVTFNKEMPAKELQDACKLRGLPSGGSKKKLLQRLGGFKRELEEKIQTDVANRLFRERERKPIAIGQPKLPSLEEQELHFVTHLPYAPWCQACVATRGREDKHQSRNEKEDIGKCVIAFDFMFTYTGDEDAKVKEDGPGKVQERQDQFGTCLVAAASETKAVLAVPVQSKGTASLKAVVEELIRFSLENASRDDCIFQADGERATRQILRTVQQVRKVMGLGTELRIVPAGSHASNGLAERAVQSVRRMANTLRSFAEEQGRVAIFGSNHLFPWSFKHAAWLLNRYRVPDGGGNSTPFELAYGHAYRGKLALFGESVMFKRAVKYKANDHFLRGVWVGKHAWNDSHVVLSSEGAFEARTIRRLATEESFRGTDMIVVKGLPWAYSPQGILMKHAGQAQKYRVPTLEEEANDKEIEDLANAVASGLATPAPLPRGGAETPIPRGGTSSPVHTGLTTPGEKRAGDGEDDEMRRKALRTREEEEAERREAKRMSAEEAEEEGRRTKEPRTEDTGSNLFPQGPISSTAEASSSRPTRRADDSPEGSPSSKEARIEELRYNIRGVEVHGDEEEDFTLIEMQRQEDEELEEKEFVQEGAEDDEPPQMSEEEVAKLDEKAKKIEIKRL